MATVVPLMGREYRNPTLGSFISGISSPSTSPPSSGKNRDKATIEPDGQHHHHRHHHHHGKKWNIIWVIALTVGAFATFAVVLVVPLVVLLNKPSSIPGEPPRWALEGPMTTRATTRRYYFLPSINTQPIPIQVHTVPYSSSWSYWSNFPIFPPYIRPDYVTSGHVVLDTSSTSSQNLESTTATISETTTSVNSDSTTSPTETSSVSTDSSITTMDSSIPTVTVVDVNVTTATAESSVQTQSTVIEPITTAGPSPTTTCISGVESQMPLHSSCVAKSANYLQSAPVDEAEILNRHNELRASTRLNPKPTIPLPPLQWNSDLAKTAENWASQCNFNHDTKEVRNVPSMGWTWVGQNLATSTSTNYTFTEAIDGWFDEINNFVYGVGASPAGSMIGHFTQVVWNTTTYVGCGKAICTSVNDAGTDFKTMVACNYGPGGNLAPKYPGYPY